jgi:5'-nucleotidase
VNIPKHDGIAYKGVKVARMARANWEEEFDVRKDPRGKTYYWLTGQFVNYDGGEDTDEWALKHHYISVVPISFDMTAHQTLAALHNLKLEP